MLVTNATTSNSNGTLLLSMLNIRLKLCEMEFNRGALHEIHNAVLCYTYTRKYVNIKNNHDNCFYLCVYLLAASVRELTVSHSRPKDDDCDFVETSAKASLAER